MPTFCSLLPTALQPLGGPSASSWPLVEVGRLPAGERAPSSSFRCPIPGPRRWSVPRCELAARSSPGEWLPGPGISAASRGDVKRPQVFMSPDTCLHADSWQWLHGLSQLDRFSFLVLPRLLFHLPGLTRQPRVLHFPAAKHTARSLYRVRVGSCPGSARLSSQPPGALLPPAPFIRASPRHQLHQPSANTSASLGRAWPQHALSPASLGALSCCPAWWWASTGSSSAPGLPRRQEPMAGGASVQPRPAARLTEWVLMADVPCAE